MAHSNPSTGRSVELRWQLLDELSDARETFGLRDRSVAVLHALLSFLPKGERIHLVVFPSNRKLSERLCGMPESTLRRHLSKLIDAGFITRRDAPNGKRYRVGQSHDLTFGFDLSPFFASGSLLRQAGDAARVLRARLRELRQRLRLAIARTPLPHAQIDALNRLLRRKVAPEILERALETLPPETPVDAAQNGCHIQPNSDSNLVADRSETKIGMDAISKIEDLTQTPIRSAADIEEVGKQAAHFLAVHDAWTYARVTRGAAWATMALAYLLPRYGTLRKPNRYLQTLVRKANDGAFDLIAALRTTRLDCSQESCG